MAAQGLASPAGAKGGFPSLESGLTERRGPGDLHHDGVNTTGRDTPFPGSHKSFRQRIYGPGTGNSSECHVSESGTSGMMGKDLGFGIHAMIRIMR